MGQKARWALGIWVLVTLPRQRRVIAPAISFDEMWTYQRARRGKKRREVWLWTAVIKLPDGRRCLDFEAGDRSGETFLRLYERLPEAHYSDDYGVYGCRLPVAGCRLPVAGGAAHSGEGETGEPEMRVCTLSTAGG